MDKSLTSCPKSWHDDGMPTYPKGIPMKTLLAILVLALLPACAPTPPVPRPAAAISCRPLPLPKGDIDYASGTWYIGDKVYGYAIEEDSTIYTSPTCLHTNPIYCQREEEGEVIGYLPGQNLRPGFPQVTCP